MTQPDKPTEPPDASRAASVATMLDVLYASEQYAAAAYAQMLRTYQDLSDDQRTKLNALRLLEIDAVEILRGYLQNVLNVKVHPSERAAEMGAAIADQPSATWHDRMLRMEGICVRGVESYRVLRSLYGAREPAICAKLLAIKIAMRDFARRELDGDHDSSLAPIVRLLPPEAQAQVTGVAS